MAFYRDITVSEKGIHSTIPNFILYHSPYV